MSSVVLRATPSNKRFDLMTATTAKTTTTPAPGALSHGSKLMIALLALWGLSVAFGGYMSTTVLAQDRDVRASEP